MAKKGISVWLFSSLTFIALLHLAEAISVLVFSNEIRLLQLVLMTVFCVSAFLINGIPVQFYSASEPTGHVPTYFDAADLQSFASTVNFTMDKSDPLLYGWYIHSFTVSGWELRLQYRITGTDTYGVRVQHAEYWWIFLTGYHDMTIYDLDTGAQISQGDYHILTINNMIAHYDKNATLLKLKCQCPHAKISMYMAFNTTKYDDIGDAFVDGGLSVMVGVGFDQINTSMNVWSIFSSLFFFHLPMIHPIINTFLTFGLWIAFAYIAGILVLRVIGAVFGGGGA